MIICPDLKYMVGNISCPSPAENYNHTDVSTLFMPKQLEVQFSVCYTHLLLHCSNTVNHLEASIQQTSYISHVIRWELV